jgi:hypothetical protein
VGHTHRRTDRQNGDLRNLNYLSKGSRIKGKRKKEDRKWLKKELIIIIIIIYKKVSKAVPLHAMEALGGRGSIAPTHSRPRH